MIKKYSHKTEYAKHLPLMKKQGIQGFVCIRVYIHKINGSRYLVENVRTPNSRCGLVAVGDELWKRVGSNIFCHRLFRWRGLKFQGLYYNVS